MPHPVTEVPAEQQRLFGLGLPKGLLTEAVELPRALARGLRAEAEAKSGKPPILVVIGNFSESDPFEVAGVAAAAENKMVQEQHLAFLQVRLSSVAEKLQHQAGSLQHVHGP